MKFIALHISIWGAPICGDETGQCMGCAEAIQTRVVHFQRCHQWRNEVMPGARSKFGAPLFEPDVFRKQIYWSDFVSLLGLICGSRFDSAPGFCAHLSPLLPLLVCLQHRKATWEISRLKTNLTTHCRRLFIQSFFHSDIHWGSGRIQTMWEPLS